MGWKRVSSMTNQPGCCLVCGGNPTDVEGNQQPSLHAEGIDVNWGDDLYLCWECVNLIADLIWRVPREDFDKMSQDLWDTEKELDELKKDHKKLQAQMLRIVDGAKARKEVKPDELRPRKRMSSGKDVVLDG